MAGRRGEVARKTIHLLASVGAAGVVLAVAHPLGAVVLAGAALVALVIETARQLSPAVGRAFRGAVGPLLRTDEHERLTGATTLALGYAVAAAAFPGIAAVGGILFAGIGDAAAAVVGRRWGRHRYHGGKSIEGSAALFACVFIIAAALPGIGAGAAVLAAAAVTVLEALALPFDDNLYLPIAGAALVALLLRP